MSYKSKLMEMSNRVEKQIGNKNKVDIFVYLTNFQGKINSTHKPHKYCRLRKFDREVTT